MLLRTFHSLFTQTKKNIFIGQAKQPFLLEKRVILNVKRNKVSRL
jgi:hypothetical protein